jgi:hypothetical protein
MKSRVSFGAMVVALLVSAFPAASAATAATGEPERAYSNRFDVSLREAKSRLDLQRRGAEIVTTLEEEQGHRYSGVWFDNQAGEFVVPVLPGVDRNAVRQDFTGLEFRFSHASSSWEELEAGQASIDASLRNLYRADLVQTGLDPRLNAVVIDVAKSADDRALREIEEVASSSGVDVEIDRAESNLLEAQPAACFFPNCPPPLRGGVEIKSSSGGAPRHCSAGFKAEGGGNKYILTAGHCTAGGYTTWEATDSSIFLPPKEKLVGPVEQMSFPINDWSKIRVNGYGEYWNEPSWPTLVSVWSPLFPEEAHAIEAEGRSYAGQYVCHSGRTSGSSCGTVTKLNVTVEYSKTEIVFGLTEFGPACINGGDSGGPVFVKHIALGLVSGLANTEAPYCQQPIIYAEITKAADDLGVKVAPRTPMLVAVVNGKKELLAKSESLSGSWVNQGGGIESVSIASDPTNGPLIGVVTSACEARVKVGLTGAWTTVESGVKEIDVATDSKNGPLIGVLTNSGKSLVKTGSIGAEWVDLGATAKEIDVATDSKNGPLIGLLTSKEGQAVVKTGSVFGEWVEVESAAKQMDLATDPTNGPLIGVVTSSGLARVKKGNLFAEWVAVEAAGQEIDVATDPTRGPSIGLRTSKEGQAIVKTGNVFGEWVEVESSSKSLRIGSDVTNGLIIGSLGSGGTALAKKGNLFDPWTFLSSGVSKVAVSG